jgi:hypothetical protein
MTRNAITAAALSAVLAAPALAQETPKPMVASYEALADGILALRRAEEAYVRSLLDAHRHAAEASMKAGRHEDAAAQMALFANEGDNAVGGVRKRLLEGGHHHNAAGEEKGLYEPGFVVVTKAAKTKLLAASRALRTATTDAARESAWTDFTAVATELLGGR